MPSVDDRLARIEEHLQTVRSDVLALSRTVGGPREPGEPTIRAQVHELLNDRAAAKLAESALARAQDMRDTAGERRTQIMQWGVSSAIAVGALLVAVLH